MAQARANSHPPPRRLRLRWRWSRVVRHGPAYLAGGTSRIECSWPRRLMVPEVGLYSVEVDQGLDDPVLFRLHHPERPFYLIEAKLMRGHRRGVHLTGLHQPE